MTRLRLLALLLSNSVDVGQSLNPCDSLLPYLESGGSASLCCSGQWRRAKETEEELPYETPCTVPLPAVASVVCGWTRNGASDTFQKQKSF